MKAARTLIHANLHDMQVRTVPGRLHLRKRRLKLCLGCSGLAAEIARLDEVPMQRQRRLRHRLPSSRR
ncbi:MAG: hypothetical protein EOO40_09450 [Deltaproteobacteria bacterium]|nr:MAG: hypothetical protein EOO40_09450 [Deltaproteobacteria bacterium]